MPSLLVKRIRFASLSAKIISFEINNNYVLDKDGLGHMQKSEGQKVSSRADLLRIIGLLPVTLSSPVTKPGQ